MTQQLHKGSPRKTKKGKELIVNGILSLSQQVKNAVKFKNFQKVDNY
jgi:hypothetical protein